MNAAILDAVLLEGEGLNVEFKESTSSKLDREMVAFANAQGGSIFLGVNDKGIITGINITNKLSSQLHDIARNCDPSIPIKLIPHKKRGILEVKVPIGVDKPYRCTDGFFLRNGPGSQKLKRDEIISLVRANQYIKFDNAINTIFKYPKDFSKERLEDYLDRCGIDIKSSADDLLISLGVANIENDILVFNNSGVLFFATNPQEFFSESCITCVQYKTFDRFSIIDKKDMLGSPIDQIEAAMSFLIAHIPAKAGFNFNFNSNLFNSNFNENHLGMRTDIYNYPLVALREAIVNAVTHRDYLYNASRIYIHLYPDRIDIENPGGLYPGLTVEMLGKRSVRRNPLIADLLHRAKYIERVGSGIDRIQATLLENNNPTMEIAATNFFNIRFYTRLDTQEELQLNPRQLHIYYAIKERGRVTRKQIADFFSISNDTAVRELNMLMGKNLIHKQGEGKGVFYVLGGESGHGSGSGYEDGSGYGGGSGSGAGYGDGTGHG